MILERLFPKETPRYAKVRESSAFLAPLLSWHPEGWISGWLMVLAGANVGFENADRFIYWDMSTFSIPLLIFVLAGGLLMNMVRKFPVFPQTANSAKGIVFFAAAGFLLFLAGTAPFGFDIRYLTAGLPYLGYFLAAWLIHSIEISTVAGKKTVPPKSEQAGVLVSALVLLSISCLVGFGQDDPIISTVSAIYIPFILVTLIFPAHVRHVQRARIYGIFIPAMFLSVRFPWILIPLAVVFYGVRKISYLQTGDIYPSFRVDLDDPETE